MHKTENNFYVSLNRKCKFTLLTGGIAPVTLCMQEA